MKKTVKIILSIIIVLLMVSVSVSSVFSETIFHADGFSYSILYDDYASICDWDGGNDTLVIPDRLHGYKVKEIDGWAFSGREDILSLSLNSADYLDTVGNMAFKNCVNIDGELVIPPTVKNIGIAAFQGCLAIDTLYYDSTAAVPNQAFYQCSDLKTVVLADGVTSIGSLSFSECENLEFVRIPNSVTSISEYTFKDSPNVTIYCYNDSYAHSYAVDNGINYTLIDASDPKLLPGDANGDGSVNINDVTAIQKYKLGMADLTEYGMLCADVNSDGEITIRDATLIQMRIANIILSF